VSRRHPLGAHAPAPQGNRDTDREEDGQWESSHFRRFPTAVLAGRHRRTKKPETWSVSAEFSLQDNFSAWADTAGESAWVVRNGASGRFRKCGKPPAGECRHPLLALLAPPRASNIAADTCDRCGVLWVSHGRVAVRGGIGPPGATTASRGPTRSTESPGPRTSTGASGGDRG
jgi:hypothetical protein